MAGVSAAAGASAVGAAAICGFSDSAIGIVLGITLRAIGRGFGSGTASAPYGHIEVVASADAARYRASLNLNSVNPISSKMTPENDKTNQNGLIGTNATALIVLIKR